MLILGVVGWSLELYCYQDYQFWTNADEGGYFSLNNVRSGDYNLYAWVPGFVGDYWNEALITMTPGFFSTEYKFSGCIL